MKINIAFDQGHYSKNSETLILELLEEKPSQSTTRQILGSMPMFRWQLRLKRYTSTSDRQGLSGLTCQPCS